MIHLLYAKPSNEQMGEMLEELTDYIKLAVDIERGTVAGGGELHADCEAALLENGSAQANIWGADWIPLTQEARYQSLINIRPQQDNPSMELLDPVLRERVSAIVKGFFEGL